MTADELSLIAGAVLSLLFSYIPGLNTWFAALLPEIKRLIMAGLVIVVAAAVFGLTCAGTGVIFGLVVTCDTAGILGLVKAVILVLVANQALFLVSPVTKSVVKAKLLHTKFQG